MAFASLDPASALCPFAVFLARSLFRDYRLSRFLLSADSCYRRLPAREAVSAASISDTCRDSMRTSTRDSTSKGLYSVVGLIESCVRDWSA